MDAIKAVQNYLNKMISDVTGMKVLLLDTETVKERAKRRVLRLVDGEGLGLAGLG